MCCYGNSGAQCSSLASGVTVNELTEEGGGGGKGLMGTSPAANTVSFQLHMY